MQSLLLNSDIQRHTLANRMISSVYRFTHIFLKETERIIEEEKKSLVPMRIELMTSALLARRSNQLS